MKNEEIDIVSACISTSLYALLFKKIIGWYVVNNMLFTILVKVDCRGSLGKKTQTLPTYFRTNPYLLILRMQGSMLIGC